MKRGFTLIELLVVIAIIAILAAILFPVFARAREKARQTSCLSNVKQLMLGVHMYAQDYDEVLPGYRYHNNAPERLYWYDVLQPYVKNEQILRCPSEADQMPGYGWNYRWISLGWIGDYPITSMGDIDRPSETVILSDANSYYVRGPGTTHESYWPPDRHNGGANFGLADGHAKWYQVAQFQNASGALQWSP
jgi:prepilin-type N-terminal cleavage/methylation domain-containing protein/prepilin-type processing-associated H-X9-DG protein